MNTGCFGAVRIVDDSKPTCAASAFDRVLRGAEKLTTQWHLIESTTRYRRELYYARHVMQLYEIKVRKALENGGAQMARNSRMSLTEALAFYRNPEQCELLDASEQSDLHAYVVAKQEYEALRAQSDDLNI